MDGMSLLEAPDYAGLAIARTRESEITAVVVAERQGCQRHVVCLGVYLGRKAACQHHVKIAKAFEEMTSLRIPHDDVFAGWIF